MPFGLCNTPLSFQRHLNYVLKGIENIFVYTDDTAIASNLGMNICESKDKFLKG